MTIEPPLPGQTPRWSPVWRFFYVIVVATAVMTMLCAWTYDDPFITYRYARNVAEGVGFVYNPGERILSTTTPLFTLLLALLYPVWPDLQLAASLIGAVSLGAGALALWDLAKTWRSPWAGGAALLLYPTFSVVLVTLSSETPLYLAFCLAAFASYARERYRLTAVWAALALLTRGDGVLVAGVLALHYLARLWRERLPVPWSALALYLALTIPWFLFAAVYFGEPLPVTLAVKQLQGGLAISTRFAPGFLKLARNYTAWNYLLLAALAAVGLVRSTLHARGWWLLWAWTGAYFAAYSLLGVSGYFWYYAPLAPGFVAASGAGVEALHGWLSGRTRRAAWLTGLAVLALATPQGMGLTRLAQQPDQRLPIYRAAGEWLNANIPLNASVGTLEVGVIGYYADRPMIDFAGLIQPEVARQFTAAATYEDSARWAIQMYRPDYVVLNPDWFPALTAEVVAACKAIQTLPGELYGYPGRLDVYACAPG